MFKEILTHDLNPQQKEAILYTKGPLFILAGAGSGKTKVIAHKFSYLLKTKGLSTDSVFTVTFTNKAAEDMKARIRSLIEKDTNSCWVGTLHSHCNRILRRDCKALGYPNSFTIYDEDDRCNLVRHILKEFNIHEALVASPGRGPAVGSACSAAGGGDAEQFFCIGSRRSRMRPAAVRKASQT